MPVPIWAGHYIGLPFKDHGRDRTGLDCWGLVRLVMAERFSIALPSFSAEYDRTTNAPRICRLINRETPAWQKIALGHERLGDVAVMRMRGKPMHVGLVLGDQQMLHIELMINSAIERYTGPAWIDRIHGLYRYKKTFTLKDNDDDSTEDIFGL